MHSSSQEARSVIELRNSLEPVSECPSSSRQQVEFGDHFHVVCLLVKTTSSSRHNYLFDVT